MLFRSSITVSNTLPRENTYRSICAQRGTVDTDKFVLVGSHHDEAGSGSPDPATGQAILREMMRLLTAYSSEFLVGNRAFVQCNFSSEIPRNFQQNDYTLFIDQVA